MKRRDFINRTAVLGSAALLPLGVSSAKEEARYKLGYQLYSVNQDMNNDPAGTLRALKAMGYEDFEVYGFDPAKLTYYGLTADTFKQLLDDLDLSATSGHYRFSDYFEKSEAELGHYVDQCIKGAKAIGTPYITWPWLAPEFRNMEGYRKLVGKLNFISKRVNAAGLGFAYHNHGYEFDDYDGANGYELILTQTDPELVKLQMDMYWVMHGPASTPKALVASQPGRFVMWHIKDMDAVTRDYTELGNGAINYLNVLPDPVESGLEYFYIEQGGNFTHSPLQSAEASARYFKANLRQLL